MISSSFSAGFSFSESPIGDFWTLLEFDGGFSKLWSEILRRGFLLSPDNSEVYLCPTNCVLSDKGPRSARRAVFSQVEPQIFYRMTRQRKTNLLSQTPSYKYSFRLNEEQEIRFRQMLSAAGLEHNRSQFIVKRLFAERFEVIRRDPSKVEFLTRLNDLYFQFQRVGNNYNQVVRAINSHFSNVSIPRQIAALEQHTRELKALSIEILNLTKQAEGWLRI